MRVQTLSAMTMTALLAACAASGGNPTTMAEQQCGALVRHEGLRLVQIDGVEPQASAQHVKMRVEDALGRRFNATCAVAANGSATWAQPLPANVSRG